MPRGTRRNKRKQRGGNRETEIVFLQLAKATMLLTKRIKVTQESEEGETKTETVETRDYVAFSLGRQMIEDGMSQDDVRKAMEAAGWEFLPDEKYEGVSIRA